MNGLRMRGNGLWASGRNRFCGGGADASPLAEGALNFRNGTNFPMSHLTKKEREWKESSLNYWKMMICWR